MLMNSDNLPRDSPSADPSIIFNSTNYLVISSDVEYNWIIESGTCLACGAVGRKGEPSHGHGHLNKKNKRALLQLSRPKQKKDSLSLPYNGPFLLLSQVLRLRCTSGPP